MKNRAACWWGLHPWGKWERYTKTGERHYIRGSDLTRSESEDRENRRCESCGTTRDRRVSV